MTGLEAELNVGGPCWISLPSLVFMLKSNSFPWPSFDLLMSFVLVSTSVVSDSVLRS